MFMALTKLQREVLVGMIMGDAYVQPTGKLTARLRIEQSEKQKDYALWKCKVFAKLIFAIKCSNPVTTESRHGVGTR